MRLERNWNGTEGWFILEGDALIAGPFQTKPEVVAYLKGWRDALEAFQDGANEVVVIFREMRDAIRRQRGA